MQAVWDGPAGMAPPRPVGEGPGFSRTTTTTCPCGLVIGQSLSNLHSVQVVTTSTWSSQLGDAVRAGLAGETMVPTVHSIRPVTDDVLEVVFSWPDDADLRGRTGSR
jgi:hypothetical protein